MLRRPESRVRTIQDHSPNGTPPVARSRVGKNFLFILPRAGVHDTLAISLLTFSQDAQMSCAK